jgi:DNA-binding MarR family transcriptional regulator
MSRPAVRTSYSLLFDVFVLGERVHELLSLALADTPLRPAEYAVYSVLFEEESVSPTAMAATLGMPLTTAVDHIRAMEARGHARRLPNPRDGRSFLVVLTAEGLRAHREANRRFEVAYRAFVEALPAGEAASRRALAGLLDAAERAGDRLASLEPQPSGPRERVPRP